MVLFPFFLRILVADNKRRRGAPRALCRHRDPRRGRGASLAGTRVLIFIRFMGDEVSFRPLYAGNLFLDCIMNLFRSVAFPDGFFVQSAFAVRRMSSAANG